jgi:hypothetical protein
MPGCHAAALLFGRRASTVSRKQAASQHAQRVGVRQGDVNPDVGVTCGVVSLN